MITALWSLVGRPAGAGAALAGAGRRGGRAAPAVAFITGATVLALAIVVAAGRPETRLAFVASTISGADTA